MSVTIDPAGRYRIRSRGVEKAAVDGAELQQLVRNLTLARHDELSEDGVTWFAAGSVESLFPSVPSTPRLIRQRQTFDELDVPAAPVQSVVTDAQSLSFARDPWFVARGSNVAGPYDRVTVVTWYREGRLHDNDQLRPGMKESWVSLGQANRDGLMDNITNSEASHRKHLIADPPVWMGPVQTPMAAGLGFTPVTAETVKVQRGGFDIVIVMIGLAAAFVAMMLVLAGVAAWRMM